MVDEEWIPMIVPSGLLYIRSPNNSFPHSLLRTRQTMTSLATTAKHIACCARSPGTRLLLTQHLKHPADAKLPQFADVMGTVAR